jgi:hypothetical protein
MSEADDRTVVGVFDERGQGELALDALRQAAFPEEQLGLAVGPDAVAEEGRGPTDLNHAEEGAGIGVLAGAALTGFFTGSLAGLLPGAIVGGLLGVFVGMGLPKEEAEEYQREFQQGRTVVTVGPTDRWDQAVAILREYGGSVKEPEADPETR